MADGWRMTVCWSLQCINIHETVFLCKAGCCLCKYSGKICKKFWFLKNDGRFEKNSGRFEKISGRFEKISGRFWKDDGCLECIFMQTGFSCAHPSAVSHPSACKLLSVRCLCRKLTGDGYQLKLKLLCCKFNFCRLNKELRILLYLCISITPLLLASYENAKLEFSYWLLACSDNILDGQLTKKSCSVARVKAV